MPAAPGSSACSALRLRNGIRLIRLRENRLIVRRLTAINALPIPAFLIERNATHRGLRLFLDLRFAIAAATPPRKREPLLDRVLKLRILRRLNRIRLAKLQRAVMQRLLNLFKRRSHSRSNPRLLHKRLPFLARPI